MKIPSQNFYLNSGNNDFDSRQKNVFEELDRLESSQPENRYSEDNDPSERPPRRAVVLTGRKETRIFKSQESIFKRPDIPRPGRGRSTVGLSRSLPDFVKNPHKWRKYSLKEEQEMSEKGNTEAAMSFLRELEKNRKGAMEDDAQILQDKIVFNKHVLRASEASCSSSKNIAEETSSDNKPYYLNGILTMPEYVVGQKKPTVKRRNTKDESKTSGKSVCTVKLDHLMDDEEED